MERLNVEKLSGVNRVAELDARYVVFAPWAKGRRVLDMGGASSRGLALLAEAEVDELTAISTDAGQLTSALADLGIEGISITPPEGPPTSFADATFDLIICHDLPERLASQPAWRTELRRILAPAGLLVLSVANSKGRFLSELFGQRFDAASSSEELFKLLSPDFGQATILGQSPVVASLFFDFAADDDEMGMNVDRALLTDDGEEPGWYVMVFGAEVPHLADLSIVQLPFEQVLRGIRSAPTVSATPVPVSPSQVDEDLTQIASLTDELARAQSELERMKSALAQAQQDFSQARVELTQAKQETETAQERLVTNDQSHVQIIADLEQRHAQTQAELEQRHAQAQAELEQRHTQAQAELEQAQKEATAAKNDLALSQQGTEQTRLELEQTRSKTTALETDVQTLRADATKLQAALDEVDRNRSRAQEVEAAAEQRVREARETAQAMLADAQESLAARLTEAQAAADARVAEAREAAKVLGDALQQAEEKARDLAAESAAPDPAMVEALAKERDTAAAAEERAAALEQEAARFQKDRLSLETQIRDLLDEVSEFRQQHDQVQDEVVKLRSALETKDEAVRATTVEIETLRKNGIGAENELTQLRDDLNRLNLKIVNTESEREALTAELAGLRQTLQTQSMAAAEPRAPEPSAAPGADSVPPPAEVNPEPHVIHDAVGRKIEATLEEIEDLLATAEPRH